MKPTNHPSKNRNLLDRYDSKPDGKGLCLILANFTDDLKGYNTDVENITKFFRDKLDFVVLGGYGDKKEKLFRDLTSPDFMKRLQETQDHLKNPSENFDKLFVFILSHGDESGIEMMSDSSSSVAGQMGALRMNSEHISSADVAEAVDDYKTYVKIQDIVNMFTHDAKGVPELKGCPKCFFLQVIFLSK